MADTLLDRLDRYVISLLDEAEATDCGDTAKDGTQAASEEGPGSSKPRASLETRIQLLRACTAYCSTRSGKMAEPEPEEPPEIDGFVTRLRPKNGTNRGRTRS